MRQTRHQERFFTRRSLNRRPPDPRTPGGAAQEAEFDIPSKFEKVDTMPSREQ